MLKAPLAAILESKMAASTLPVANSSKMATGSVLAAILDSKMVARGALRLEHSFSKAHYFTKSYNASKSTHCLLAYIQQFSPIHTCTEKHILSGRYHTTEGLSISVLWYLMTLGSIYLFMYSCTSNFISCFSSLRGVPTGPAVGK